MDAIAEAAQATLADADVGRAVAEAAGIAEPIAEPPASPPPPPPAEPKPGEGETKAAEPGTIEGAGETKAAKEETPPASPPPPPPPASPPPAPVQRQPSREEARLTELEAMMNAPTFDPWSAEGKKANIEHSRLAGVVAAQPLREQLAQATVWTGLSKQTGVAADALESTWADVVEEVSTRTGFKEGDPRLQGACDYVFGQKIEAMKTATAPPPASPPPPPPPPASPPAPPPPPGKPAAPAPTPVIGKGQVLPRGVGAVPPQPPDADTRTVEEKMEAGDLNKDMAELYSEMFE